MNNTSISLYQPTLDTFETAFFLFYLFFALFGRPHLVRQKNKVLIKVAYMRKNIFQLYFNVYYPKNFIYKERLYSVVVLESNNITLSSQNFIALFLK